MMKFAWRLRERLSGFVAAVHPDIAGLLDWAEGKAGTGIAEHLSRCPACREHAALLRASLQDRASATLVDEVAAALRERMREFRVSGSNVEAALEHYFGKRALRTLENSDIPNATPPNAKRLFHAFLGRKAADALASRIASAA